MLNQFHDLVDFLKKLSFCHIQALILTGVRRRGRVSLGLSENQRELNDNEIMTKRELELDDRSRWDKDRTRMDKNG